VSSSSRRRIPTDGAIEPQAMGRARITTGRLRPGTCSRPFEYITGAFSQPYVGSPKEREVCNRDVAEPVLMSAFCGSPSVAMQLARSRPLPVRAHAASRLRRKAAFVILVTCALGVISYVNRAKGPPPPLFGARTHDAAQRTSPGVPLPGRG
jgi:hypothetical protein